MTVRAHLDLIRTPGAGRLLIGGTIGRLPYGMEIVAVAGASVGAWIAGALIDAVSVEAALACAPVVAAAALVVAVSGRRSLAATQAA
jgi:hypothetical protein